ncbi:hypothetical protein AZO1586R_914 [Bathymodiolus azoricus thioautotrophic gill symbiont]|uniref:Uncharacterized protein n=1 Tax=Bathymodiolus azoricus thioautotrophic gill symbiont TaxID=235205 RepID=A0ACA8ZPK0_9GAMM|nr:hypothetical protein AZO1586R_914 [Bathymodiolus azoricus thioautotrophic gill symbiont]
MLRQRQPGVKALQKANKTLLNLQKEVYLTLVGTGFEWGEFFWF